MRLIVALLLTTLTASAWGEWVKYAETKDTVEYYDPATIKRKSNVRRVWMITDLKLRGKYDELSQIFLSEFDCKEQRWRILFVSAQSARMGGGATLGTDDSGETWNDIAPKTASGVMLNIVCEQPRQQFI